MSTLSPAAKIARIAAFLKNCPGFEKHLQNIKIVTLDKRSCVAHYTVEAGAANIASTMHGGFAATLVDSVSTYALHSEDGEEIVPSFTVDMHLTYMKAIPVGEKIIIDAKTMRMGRNLAYLKVDIRNEKGDVLISGLHTKYMMNSTSLPHWMKYINDIVCRHL